MKTFEAQLLTSFGISVFFVINWSFQTNATPVDFLYDEEVDPREEMIQNLVQELNELRNSMSKEYNTTSTQEILLRLLSTISNGKREGDSSKLSKTDASQLLPLLLREAFSGNISEGVDPQNSSALVTKLKNFQKLSREEMAELEAELKQIVNPSEKSSRRTVRPRGIFENLMRVMTDLGKNMTNHNASAPTPPIIQSAMGAVNVLNRLGLLEPITDFIQYEIEFLSSDY